MTAGGTWKRTAVALGGLCVMNLSSPAAGQDIPIDGRRPSSQDLCISDHFKSASASRFSQPEVEILVSQVSRSLGQSNIPQVIPCYQTENAEAVYRDDRGEWRSTNIVVPAGEYILYNPPWTRQVIGSDRGQAIVLFGHELGHFINRDFNYPRINVSVLVRETEADRFAGCAAARMGVSRERVNDLLSRLRDEVDSDHPRRPASLEAANAGYGDCLSTAPPTTVPLAEPPSAGLLESLLDAKRLEESGRLTEARAAYGPLCGSGAGEACRLLGAMQQDGIGGQPDLSLARMSFARGCVLGDDFACYGEGQILEAGGPAVAPDPQRSRVLYQRSCEAGASLYNAVNCYGLGNLEAKGIGGPADIIDARVRFEKSCKIGFSVACYGLALFYQGGLGGDLDIEAAERFRTKACTLGYQPACR